MTPRRLGWVLHRYVGLGVGLLLLLTGLSGSALVFRDEIEAFMSPQTHMTTAHGAPLPVDRLLQIVRAAFPDDRVIAIRMPATPHRTTLFRMNAAHDLEVFVDPYSGAIVGSQNQNRSLMGRILRLHTTLLAGESGETLLGINGLLLVVLCLTGVVVWWPRRKNRLQAQTPAGPVRRRARTATLHRRTGIVSAVLLTVTALTGAGLVFDKPVAALIDTLTDSPPRGVAPRVRATGEPVHASLDAMLRVADRVLPGTTTWINLPRAPEAPVLVRKKHSTESHPNGRNFVYFDPYTGAMLRVDRTDAAALGTRITNLFYPLHTGAVGGTPGRMIQAVVGVTPALLFLTGLAIWGRRRARGTHRTSVSTPAGKLGQRGLPVIVLAVAGLHAGLIGILLSPDANRPLTPPRALTVSLVAPSAEMRRDPAKPEPRPTQPEPRPTQPQPRPRPDASPAPRPVVSPAPAALAVAEPPLQTTGPAAAANTPSAIADAQVEPASNSSPAESSRPEPTPLLAAEAPASTPAASTPPHAADYLNNPKPPYPALSRRLGEAGTVRLNVLINPDGSVARLELAQSSGHPRLDRAAVETVQSHWKFEPARQRGQPVSAWVIVPIEFTLRS